jgi:hypothetical protein
MQKFSIFEFYQWNDKILFFKFQLCLMQSHILSLNFCRYFNFSKQNSKS